MKTGRLCQLEALKILATFPKIVPKTGCPYNVNEPFWIKAWGNQQQQWCNSLQGNNNNHAKT